MKKGFGLTFSAGKTVCWLTALLYWEVLLHTAVFGAFSIKVAYILGFSLSISLILALADSLIPKKAALWVDLAVTLVLTVLYGSQLVYNFIFGTLYSVSMMAQGGEAMTSFWRETVSTMLDKLPWMLALLVPAAALFLLRKVRITPVMNWFSRGVALAAAVLLGAGLELLIAGGGTGMYSDYDYYHSDSVATNQMAERYGLLTTIRLEVFGSGGESVEEELYVPAAPVEAATQETAPEEKVVEYNVMDIDLDELSTMTEDKKILAINEYIKSLTGTNKNEYTGMLSDYNLIVLCGESFSKAAIHPELTPTLYKLANEGIIFNNYYNSYPNTTTDGEYALMQGLFPDSTRNKGVSSQYASRNSYLPFTLGIAFQEQKGVESFGYHNYRGTYYGRNESHPNMGYTMKFMDEGMKFSSTWPSSDLEMMEQSVDDWVNQDQFHAYYMTFSGHYQYDTGTNKVAAKNWELVENLPYSRHGRAYLSCHIELDKALEYMMQRLEEAGVLDKTAIVLAGDHFPYGLTEEEYSELVGYEIDKFSQFHDTLIFWVGGLEKNIVVDEYCCNVDILPTILNLWGFEYDSRMLAGTDVFSDGEHVAVLVDKSFLTDKVWFSTNKGEIRYLVPESEVPEGYIDNMNRMIETKYTVSANILNKAYYNFAFGKEAVTVNRVGWHKTQG